MPQSLSKIIRRPKPYWGLTLVEVLIAASLLLLLMGVLTMVYASSARIWRKVDQRTSLIREVQVAARYIEGGIRLGHPFGLTYSQNISAIAYLSALDSSDQAVVNPGGKLLWQKFILTFVDTNGLLRQRQLPLGAPTPDAPTFIDTFNLHLDGYFSANPTLNTDRYLTHSGKISEFKLKPVGNYGSLFELTINGTQDQDAAGPEKLSFKTTISVRN